MTYKEILRCNHSVETYTMCFLNEVAASRVWFITWSRTQLKHWLFTIYKTFPDNPVGKLMEHEFSGFFFQWRMFRSNETSEYVVQFSRSECSKRKFVFHFNKTMFDTTFTPSQWFSVKGTDFTNGKRDSGTKFTSLEFCLPSAQTVNGPVCPCIW